ncbi:MAG: flagellar biosynthetic protein FliR [Planctomycetota bacterium]
MLEVGPLFQHGIAVLIVAFRLTGLLIFSPMLAGAAIPRQAKVILVVTLAFAIYPALPTMWQMPMQFSLVTVAQLFVTETLIGAAVGFLASLPILAVQLGGQIMGQQMGLGLAQVFNPELETNTGVIDQLLFYTALAVFISFGGVEITFSALMNTYESVPLGAMTLTAIPLELMVGTLSAGFELAMRVAAPILGIMIIETVATGVLMKTIPQINIMSVGFSLKTLAGLFGLAAAVTTIFLVFADEAAGMLASLVEWTTRIAPLAPPAVMG